MDLSAIFPEILVVIAALGIPIGGFLLYEYHQEKKKQKRHEMEMRESEEKRKAEIEEAGREYHREKTKITVNDITPLETGLNLKDDESVYLVLTHLFSQAIQKRAESRIGLHFSLLFLTSRKLILFYDSKCEGFDLEEIESMNVGLFSVEFRFKTEFDRLELWLNTENIVRFERTAEKLGIPLKWDIEEPG